MHNSPDMFFFNVLDLDWQPSLDSSGLDNQRTPFSSHNLYPENILHS